MRFHRIFSFLCVIEQQFAIIFFEKLRIANSFHELRNKRLRIADFFHELQNKRLRVSTKFAIFNSAIFSSTGNSFAIISSLKVLMFLFYTSVLSLWVRSSQRDILLKYLFFFPGVTSLKRFLEHIKFSRRTKNGIKTHIYFPEEAKCTQNVLM